MCFWHQIDRRENNENVDQYLSLCYGLRLFSATDFDDIFVWSVLKLTLYEPNYKEKEVHWPIRKTNSGIGSEYFALYSLARFGWVCMKYIHIRYWPSVRSRWMDIGQVLLLRYLWTETKSGSIKTQKKNKVNIQPSWPNKLGQERKHIPQSISSRSYLWFLVFISSPCHEGRKWIDK